MRKSFLRIVVTALLLASGIAGVVLLVQRNNGPSNQQPRHNPNSVLAVLQSHGYNNHERQSFRQNATMTYYSGSSVSPQILPERTLKLSINGSLVRFDKTAGNKDQRFLSNGQTLVRTTYHAGTKVEAKVLTGTEADSARFQIATFGLLPILRRLSDPGTQVTWVETTSKGNRFQVKTVNGSWYFYTTPNHLIDRLEVDNIIITYGDYRTVDGLNLPFYQQVSKGDKLLYEIRFDTADFNPVAAELFQSNLL